MGAADDDRFRRAIAAIDAANAEDPVRVVVRGRDRPKEVAHAELVTEWVERLRPDPPEPLLLAARAHHLRRWAVPRSTYPDGRAGYLRWRRDLHERHAEEVGGILTEVGYDPATIARVRSIVRKRKLTSDPDVQTLEDALCLVFLETQFSELAARTANDKMVDITRKTLAKMSPAGTAAALTLAESLPPGDRRLLEQALA
jgi:Domain of unknown function (DUF4202)